MTLCTRSSKRPAMGLFLVLLGGLLALSSCGFGRMATGVVVWAPQDSTVSNGDLVWIWEKSRIRKSFKIERPQGGGAFEVDQWRVLSFPGDGEAKDFLKTFATMKNTWAISGKQGLPVRETADANSNRVYKLGEGEKVKVLQANGPRVKEGNLEGSWVQVLTKDGYSGWVFDYYLTLENINSDGKIDSLKASGAGDQLIQSVLAQSWYPAEMKDMVDQNRILLARFREDAGLRAESSPAAFLVVLPGQDGQDERWNLPVDNPRKISDFTYDFGGPNHAIVQFTNGDGSALDLSFVDQGQKRTISLTLLDENVGTTISRELSDRQQKLAEILGRGKTLVSPTYGILRLADDGTFAWSGASAFLGTDEVVHGQLVFDWYKDKRWYGEYRGLRLTWGKDPKETSKIFLYRFLRDGIQLLPAEGNDLDPVRQTVVREPKNGISLYFSFQN